MLLKLSGMSKDEWNTLKTKRLFLTGYLLVSAVFGIAFMLTPVMKTVEGKRLNWLHLPLGMLIFFVGSAAAFTVSTMVSRLPRWEKQTKRGGRILALLCFTAIVVVDIFYLLVYYPGTGMYDTLLIVSSTGFSAARQHPWFYMLLVQMIVKCVQLLGGGYEAALVALSLIQICLSAGIFTHCLMWLRNKRIHPVLWVLIAMSYAFYPYFNLCTICIFKDIPFSLILILWCTILYDAWESKGASLCKKSIFAEMCVLLVLALLRNNGIYVSAFILLSIFLFLPKKWEYMRLFLTEAGILILVIIGNHLFESSHDIEHLFKETVGIPLQQIAAAVCNDGVITEEQSEFINNVIPLEFIKENYNPYTADKLKWGGAPLDNAFLNSHKGEFLKVWFEMLRPNFKTYVTAYLRNTYGFWSLSNEEKSTPHTSIYTEAWSDWYEEENISIKQIFPSDIQEKLEDFFTPLTRVLTGQGIIFWIFILFLMIMWRRYGFWSMLVGVPVLGNWLTIMISTPVAYQWRYVYCTALLLPLMAGILCISKREGITEEQNT